MLIKKDDRIIRVLETKGDHKLIINCSQKSMPTWIAEEDLSGYVSCAAEELGDVPVFEELSPQQQRYAHERYILIAGVMPFLGDKKLRSEAISRIAEARNIIKQTIRHYLHRYLMYQSIAALAPPPKGQRDELTADEKNMRRVAEQVLLHAAEKQPVHSICPNAALQVLRRERTVDR